MGDGRRRDPLALRGDPRGPRGRGLRDVERGRRVGDAAPALASAHGGGRLVDPPHRSTRRRAAPRPAAARVAALETPPPRGRGRACAPLHRDLRHRRERPRHRAAERLAEVLARRPRPRPCARRDGLTRDPRVAGVRPPGPRRPPRRGRRAPRGAGGGCSVGCSRPSGDRAGGGAAASSLAGRERLTTAPRAAAAHAPRATNTKPRATASSMGASIARATRALHAAYIPRGKTAPHTWKS